MNIKMKTNVTRMLRRIIPVIELCCLLGTTLTGFIESHSVVSGANKKEYKLSCSSLKLYVGHKNKISIKFNGTIASKMTKRACWISSNKEVATVSKGIVTAKKQGKAIITVKVHLKRLRCKVSVYKKQDNGSNMLITPTPFTTSTPVTAQIPVTTLTTPTPEPASEVNITPTPKPAFPPEFEVNEGVLTKYTGPTARHLRNKMDEKAPDYIEANIIIPEGIVRIGDDVFSNSVLYERDPFANAEDFYKTRKRWLLGPEVTSVIFPDSLEVIGENAFAHCELLTRVTFGKTVPVIEQGAFLGCCNLKEAYTSDGRSVPLKSLGL